ncbi:MAG: hypothetical protein GEV10_16665 [Streptosporangiales bacterium]|nr:hypothetical protein [Streptosporangiales bacterium]
MHVLITEPVHDSALAWLRDQGAIVTLAYEDAAWRESAGDVRGLVVRACPVDVALLDELPALEVVAKHGSGVNTIDLAATAARGIRVTNVPGANTDAVAEHAVALLSALSRDLVDCDRLVRQGRFDERFGLRQLKELTGSRLGLVGAGRVGRRVAAICRGGYDCRIGVYDPFLGDDTDLDATRFGTVADLVEWADNVVVAAPLTPQTRGLLDAGVLGRLGVEGSLVCASRGGIVDETALAELLRDGRLRGAALDVYEPEPPGADHPLFALGGTAFTPHVGYSSDRSMVRMGVESCRQLWALLHGGDAPLVTADSWG